MLILYVKKLGLAVTITPLNQNVDLIYDHLYQLPNVDCVSMKFIRNYDGSKYDFDNFDVPYLISRYEKLCTNILRELEEGNFDYLVKLLNGADLFGNLIVQNIYKGINFFYACDAGKNRIAVNSVGDIFACSVMVGNNIFRIGNIYIGINTKKQKKFFIPTRNVEKSCNKCVIKNLCGGECYANAYLKCHNMYTKVNKMCRLKIELHKLSITFLEYVRKNFQFCYKRLVNYSFKVQAYDTSDSAIWAIFSFLKSRKINIKFDRIINELVWQDNGVTPENILKFLKKYNSNIDAYQIEANFSINNDILPGICYLNKIRTSDYIYWILLKEKRNKLYFITNNSSYYKVYKIDKLNLLNYILIY